MSQNDIKKFLDDLTKRTRDLTQERKNAEDLFNPKELQLLEDDIHMLKSRIRELERRVQYLTQLLKSNCVHLVEDHDQLEPLGRDVDPEDP